MEVLLRKQDILTELRDFSTNYDKGGKVELGAMNGLMGQNDDWLRGQLIFGYVGYGGAINI